MFGQNAANTAANTLETTISATNVGKLAPKWTFKTGGDVSARAAVVNGVVYFPDWGGNLFALNANNGKLIWSTQLATYFPTASGPVHSRTTPAVSGNVLYLGTQEGAYLLAINTSNGQLLWKTQLESVDPLAIVTSSAVIAPGLIVTGVASLAEGGQLYGADGDLASNAPRGSVVAVTPSGQIQWKTYTVPAGYTGAGVWGSNLVVDSGRNMVYAGTGDNYTHPADWATSSIPGVTFKNCVKKQLESFCLAPNDYVDSILALNLKDGSVVWSQRLVSWNQQGVTNGSDDFNLDCFLTYFGYPSNGPECPVATPNTPIGPDYDFGSAPNEITYSDSSGKTHTIIGAGQKSGIYYAFDPDTGESQWPTQRQVGSGSSLGGMEWGSSSDGKRIYVAIANNNHIPAGTAGSWAALDPASGTTLWQTADPNGAIDIGPTSVANGVVYAGSMAGNPKNPNPDPNIPNMVAMDATNGNILWTFPGGYSVGAGASIVNGVVYWGSGYSHLGLGTGSSTAGTFYAFSINGN